MNIVKPILAIAVSFLCLILNGQSVDSKTISNLKSDCVIIVSNYPDIELKSWGGIEIKIESEVTINGKNHNGAYTLEIKNASGGICIDAIINTELLKKKVIVNNEDGSKLYYDFDGFDNLNYEENDNVTMNIGYEIDAKIVISVPKEMKVETSTLYGDINSKGSFSTLKLNSTYGMIEAEVAKMDKMEKLELESTYDIIDLTIDPKLNANISMSTSYGEVYSDLKLKSTSSTQRNHCGSNESYIMNGGGLKINLVSTYDNIYLRSKKSL
ncbi:MAG: hypothetical protein ACI86M_002220 [Saprospiraceae bacterium]|jgi:hypothetical protein